MKGNVHLSQPGFRKQTSLAPLLTAASLVLSGVLGCSASPKTEETLTPDAGAQVPLFGSIVVSLRETVDATAAYGLVSGTIYDGPRPDPEPLRVIMEDGECQLREALHPLCSEGCGSGAVCVDTEECAPYPQAQNVGDLSVTGLGVDGEESVTLGPFPPSFFYQSQELAYPPCEEGATLRLEANAFSAEARCIAPLLVDSSAPLRVRSREPLTLTWERPADPSLARVQVLLDVSHHGGKRGDIVCDAPDTGGLEISAPLITALVDMGLAGFPSVILTRRTQATSTQPNVRLVVAASVARTVDTGVQSCLQDTGNDGCPEGQTCDRTTLTCQ